MPPASAPLGPSYAKAFLAQLNSIASPAPTAAQLALMKQIATSPNVTPEQLEACWSLLGNQANMPTMPRPSTTLSFPLDHSLHPDASIEWYYFTLSLPLNGGGTVSVVCNFFRKTLAPSSLAPWATGLLGRSICSTSVGITIEMPGQAGKHYSWPVKAYFGNDTQNVTFTGSPFHWSLGKQSISGTNNVFPLHIHLEDPGDGSRPPIVIDVDAAATNPFFLQGLKGYVGDDSTTGYEYYSWPQQRTTGTVTIQGTSYNVADGLTWMDHQWGGSAPTNPNGWGGWSWFEFQLEGNRALTFSATHGPIPPSGIITPVLQTAFGTYVGDGITSLVGVGSLTLSDYVASPYTGTLYPTAWAATIAMPGATPIDLNLTIATSTKPQALWMGGLNEYAEAAASVTAVGTIGRTPVNATGVGYCETVGAQSPTEANTARMTYLQSGQAPAGFQ